MPILKSLDPKITYIHADFPIISQEAIAEGKVSRLNPTRHFDDVRFFPLCADITFEAANGDLTMSCVINASKKVKSFLKEQFSNETKDMHIDCDGVTEVKFSGREAIETFLKNVDTIKYQTQYKAPSGIVNVVRPFMNEMMIDKIYAFINSPSLGKIVLPKLAAQTQVQAPTPTAP